MNAPLRWIAGLSLAVVGIAGLSWRSASQAPDRPARGIAGARLVGARGGEPLESSGTIEGTLVRVAAKLPGRVDRVLVQEGARVRAGQLLLALEDREINAQVDQARAHLATAAARYEEAVAGTRPESIRQAEAELQRAIAARDGAVAAARNLESQLERSTELRQNREAAQSQVAATRATVQASVARLERLKAGARPDELREAQEAVTAAEATARNAGDEEERARRSYEEGAVARRDWDRARTERDVAAAHLGKARAHLADLRAGARREEIQEAEQQVAAARANYRGALSALANARQLERDRLPARQRLDAARAELRAATSAVAAARAQLDLLRRGTRAEVVQQLRAQRQEARAALVLADSRRQDLQIRAPVPGMVTLRAVEPGEVVLPGTRLIEVADRRRTWVRVYLPEKDYGRVRVGDRVQVTTDSLPDRVFAGRVGAIAQEAEYTPRNVQTKEERVNLMFAVKVDIDDRRGELHIGMPADVRFP